MSSDLMVSPVLGNSEDHSRRTRILRIAERLMLNRGYAATSVDQICVEAGVTKGAFFHHFNSKELMAEELLKHSVENTLAPLAFALDPRPDPDPLSRLHRMFRAMLAIHDGAKTKGCLIGIFTQELALDHENIRKLCAAALGKLQRSVEKELRAARKMHAGRTNAPFKARTLAAMLVALIQGSHILGRAMGEPSYMKRILTEYQAIVDGAVRA